MKTDQRYGPQTEQVVELLLAIRSLTDDERDALNQSRERESNAAWDASNALSGVLRDAPVLVRDAVKVELWKAWNVGLRGEAWEEVRNAVWALVLRDQIGDEFTQDHYDLLTTTWRRVVGSIHPDDKEIKEK